MYIKRHESASRLHIFSYWSLTGNSLSLSHFSSHILFSPLSPLFFALSPLYLSLPPNSSYSSSSPLTLPCSSIPFIILRPPLLLPFFLFLLPTFYLSPSHFLPTFPYLLSALLSPLPVLIVCGIQGLSQQIIGEDLDLEIQFDNFGGTFFISAVASSDCFRDVLVQEYLLPWRDLD